MKYFQHTGQDKFTKFGKVMKRFSDLLSNTIQEKINKLEKNGWKGQLNVHRPFPGICGPCTTRFSNSLFHIVHYTGSWEDYNSKTSDLRRKINITKDSWGKDTGAYYIIGYMISKNVSY